MSERRDMMNNGRLLALILLFTVAAAGLALASANGDAAASAAPPAVQESLSAPDIEGEVRPAHFVRLSFQDGGTVQEILVAEGDAVQSGDPLLRLNDVQQQIAVARAEAQLLGAEAAREAAANQQVAAQAAVESAEAERESAGAQLALLEAGPRPEEIAAAESRLAAAQSGVARAIAARDAQLESVGTASQIESARAELATANAELTALQQQYDTIIDSCFDTPQGEVCPLYGPVEETTRAQLEAAEVRVAAAQTALDRLQSGATEAQQQAANSAVAAAVAQRDQAQAQLALLQAGATPAQLHQAEVAVSVAQAQVDVARARAGEVDAALAQADAAVQAAGAGVEAARLALERTVLRAPFDGAVADLSPNPGELVAPQTAVVTLTGGGQWTVVSNDLTELDVPHIEVGSSITVTFDAFPEANVPGAVSEIALFPGMQHGDVTYELTVTLDENDLPLRWGMTAYITPAD